MRVRPSGAETTSSTRLTRLATALPLSLLSASAIALAAPAAKAQADDERSGVDVDVSVGVNGAWQSGGPALVHVSISADELIDGEFVASMQNSAITLRQEIEIAAGTTKEYTFTLPTMWDEPRVEVTVLDDGDEVASASGRARMTNDELVGVLPRLAARFEELPPQVRLPEGIGSAQIAVIPAGVVDLGVSGLQSFDTIVAGADDLTELTERQREDVLRWVSLGGILVLDDGESAAALPDEWQPGRGGYAWAGLGEVRIVDGAASDGDWADFIAPTPVGQTGMMMGSEMMVDPQRDLAGRSGVDLPSIAPLAIGVVAYAVVLGPVLYFVLRRWRRLTLGWVVIPAVAVLTAGGIAVAGNGVFDEGEPATATFVQTTPGGAYAISTVLTYSSAGGTNALTTPAGWGHLDNAAMWFDPMSRPIEIEPHPDGTQTTRERLEATQASVRSFEGPADAVPLEITAELDGSTISGTITNDGDTTLRDVAVFAGQRQVNIGEVPAGETVEWELRAQDVVDLTFETRGARAWGEPWGPNGEPDDRSGEFGAEFGIWGTTSGRLDLFPAGMARVVGWTDARPDDLVPDASSRTAVSALTPVSGELGAPTVRYSITRGPFMAMMGPGTSDQVVRYLLPPDADTSDADLVLLGTNRLDIEEVSFWTGSEWEEADASLDAIPVPPAAVRNGAVLVTTDVDMNTGMPAVLTLTTADEAAEAADPDETDE